MGIFIKNDRPDEIFPNLADIIDCHIGREISTVRDLLQDALIYFRFIHIDTARVFEPLLKIEILCEGSFSRSPSSDNQIDFRVESILIEATLFVKKLGIVILKDG
jgi:hypothetical protein